MTVRDADLGVMSTDDVYVNLKKTKESKFPICTFAFACVRVQLQEGGVVKGKASCPFPLLGAIVALF